MPRLHVLIVLCALAVSSVPAAAQSTQRVRGTITAFDGTVLSVKSRDGRDLRIRLTEKASVATVKALALTDIRPGDGIGTSATRRDDGALVALEIHKFPAERGVPNEGQRPWDLEPGSTMTNAAVDGVVDAAGGQELTLTYNGVSQKLVVPPGTPIVMAVAADRTALRPGEHVFLSAQSAADGTLSASRIQVSKDGVKPPQ
jgi:hypothetical protein